MIWSPQPVSADPEVMVAVAADDVPESQWGTSVRPRIPAANASDADAMREIQ